MKAALVRAGDKIEVSDYPTPEPGPGEVVVKVAYCGVCGTDIHMLEVGFLSPGSIIGHEISGYIAAVGDGVEGWDEGDPVAVSPIDPCFACEPCKGGDTNLCREGLKRSYGLGRIPGGFSQYMLAKPSMLYRVPEELDIKTVALNEPLAIAMHGVNMLDLKGGDLVLLMGAGPIGLFCVYTLRSAGLTGIYVSEPDKYRADRAATAGVEGVFDPAVNDPGSAIQEGVGRAPNYVIDCAGTESSIQEAVGIVGPRGKVVVVGVHMGNVSLMPILYFGKEVQLNFSYRFNYREFDDCLQLLAKGTFDPEVLISEVMPLSEIGQAFQMLHETGHMKILIDCQAV